MCQLKTSIPLLILYFFVLFRSSEQDFGYIHGKIRRGDIVGVKGRPGKISILCLTFSM